MAKKVQASGEDEKDSSPQVVREINVVVLGAKGVGKTELIAHYRKQPSSTHVSFLSFSFCFSSLFVVVFL